MSNRLNFGYGLQPDEAAAPARNVEPAVLSDDQDLMHIDGSANSYKSLWVGVGGDVAIIPILGTEPVIFKNVPSGYKLDVCVRRVLKTGTTAQNIIGYIL